MAAPKRTELQRYFLDHPECAEHILSIVYPGTPIVKYSKFSPFVACPYTWVTIEAQGISLTIDNAHHDKKTALANKAVGNLKVSFNMFINNVDKTKVKLTPEIKEKVFKYITEDLKLGLISPEDFVHKKATFFTPHELAQLLLTKLNNY